MRVRIAFFCLLAPLFPLALAGCSLHRQPISDNRIILLGEPNPSFRAAPSRAGEIIRESDQPRHLY